MTTAEALAISRNVWETQGHGTGLRATKLQRQFVRALELLLAAAFLFLFVLPVSATYAMALLGALGLATVVTSPWQTRLSLSVLDDIPLLIASFAAAQGVAYWIAAVAGSAPSPGSVVLTSLLTLSILVTGRLFGYAMVKGMRRAGALEGVIVVGGGRNGRHLTDCVTRHPQFGLIVEAHLTPNGDTPLAIELATSLRAVPSARTVILADNDTDDGELLASVRGLVAAGYSVFYVPRFPELRTPGLGRESVWGLPLVALGSPSGRVQAAIKRAFDIAASAAALVVLSPLLAAVGLLIKRETGGAILFRQQRVGRAGRLFELLKFQTMVPASASEADEKWTIADDERLGRIGRFLRATSIDELPQLYNVFRGDMSLVGPRPERPHFVEVFSHTYPHYADRHRVPVGLTGWAQIHRLRGDTSIEDRALFDNAYCDQWSVWTDAKILMKTLPEVVRHSGS